jgi:hypothetical protein
MPIETDPSQAAFAACFGRSLATLCGIRRPTSSRVIESLCRRDVQIMAASGDRRQQFTTIAAFVSRSAEEIAGLFTEVLLVCSLQGLTARD